MRATARAAVGAWLVGVATVTVALAVLRPVGTDAAATVIGVIRVGGIAAGCWLLLSTVLSAVADALHWRALARAADALAPTMVRRFTGAAFGFGLLVAPGVVAAEGTGPTSSPPVMRAAETPPTMREIAPVTAAAPAGPVSDSTRSFTAQRGDHLWSIARRSLAASLGRPPTDAEVDPYWRRLIEHNRGRLADPDNPDLIFPGQEFELPPA